MSHATTDAGGEGFAAVIARTWLAFSVMTFAGAVAGIVLDGDNPLHSDDPYLMGFVSAIAPTFCTASASIAAYRRRSPKAQRVAYFLPLAGMVGLLLVWDAVVTMAEGQGLATFAAVVIAAGGLLAYPLRASRLDRWSLIVGSIPGIMCLVGYAYVGLWLR